jgi:hypothetical protein
MYSRLIPGDFSTIDRGGRDSRRSRTWFNSFFRSWPIAASFALFLPVPAVAWQVTQTPLQAMPQTVSPQTYPQTYLDRPPAPLQFVAETNPVSLNFDSLATQPVRSPSKPYIPLEDCPYDKTKARECRVHWRQLLISSAVFLTWQNAANAYSSYWYRYETTTGNWWQRYINSVVEYKYSIWSDGNPDLDDYVGHPLMGSITDALWVQNDPKGMTLEFSNTRPYWISRARALAFTTVYSTEWKLGPIGESGVGHMGDHLSYENGHVRNETGFVSLVTTPIGGTMWFVAEDLIDKGVTRRLEDWNRNPFLLMAYSFLTPGHTTGNLLRFRPPWYRDSRVVKANSFWSDPEPEPAAKAAAEERDRHEEISHGPDNDSVEKLTAAVSATTSAATYVTRPALQKSTLPGGSFELGAWWGLSVNSGDLWGGAVDVKYMPIDVRFSYRFLLHDRWALRYSPEITALAMLDESTPKGAAPFNLRKRTYGSGLSPEGFQADFFPHSRMQPFLSNNAGFIYFADKVLAPQGSQFMYIIDFGVGVNIFRKETQVVTLGYRYQHLGNGNISPQNQGTDANTFYVGVSRFRTKRGDHSAS